MLPRIVVEGDIMVEYICALDHFPGLDRTLVLNPAAAQIGGNALNLCFYLRQLGHLPTLRTHVGTDRQDALEELMSVMGLDPTSILPITSATNTLVIFEEEDGARGLYLPSLIVPDDERADLPRLPRDAVLIYGGSRNTVLQQGLVERLKHEPTCKLIFAPSYALLSMSEATVRALLTRASMSFFNRTEATALRAMMGISDLQALVQAADTIIVETLDRDGAIVYSRSECYAVPARTISLQQVVGPGDGFVAGFADAWLRGATIEAAARFASDIAGQIVEANQIRVSLDLERLRDPLKCCE
jgi:sugar/nucleoside kinase (ribokinase family)